MVGSQKEDSQGGQSDAEGEECAEGWKGEGAGGDDHPVRGCDAGIRGLQQAVAVCRRCGSAF